MMFVFLLILSIVFLFVFVCFVVVFSLKNFLRCMSVHPWVKSQYGLACKCSGFRFIGGLYMGSCQATVGCVVCLMPPLITIVPNQEVGEKL